VVVFLLDARVRKIESVTAVFEFLDFKKSYVSHISHELHTPLHAATLGLNMAITQMNKHNNITDDHHVVDNDLIETLCGVRLACHAAFNSLDGFLFSEQTDHDILDLCLETIPVVDYVRGAINNDIISEHAVSKLIELDLLFHVDATVLAIHPMAIPLRSSDCISCDRSKMDQVLQKLVNNAIKFSQKESTVMIRAYFCPLSGLIDDHPIISSMAVNENSLMVEESEGGVDISIQGNNSNITENTVVGKDHNNQISSPINSSSSLSPSPEDIVGHLMITVTDTGPGITAERQKHLFRGVIDRRCHYHHDDDDDANQNDSINNDTNPTIGSQRTIDFGSLESKSKSSASSSSSGFGLFISRCIVDLHKGGISFPQPFPHTFFPFLPFSIL